MPDAIKSNRIILKNANTDLTQIVEKLSINTGLVCGDFKIVFDLRGIHSLTLKSNFNFKRNDKVFLKWDCSFFCHFVSNSILNISPDCKIQYKLFKNILNFKKIWKFWKFRNFLYIWLICCSPCPAIIGRQRPKDDINVDQQKTEFFPNYFVGETSFYLFRKPWKKSQKFNEF